MSRRHDWLRQLRKLVGPRPILKRLDGSIIAGANNVDQLILQVPLRTCADWMTPDEADDTHKATDALFEALYGHNIQIEVLPLPISLEERITRIRSAEHPTPTQRRDPDWQSASERRAVGIAEKLASRSGGDWEPCGFIMVSLHTLAKPQKMAVADFLKLSDKRKFYTERSENAHLLGQAQEVYDSLVAIWPGIEPAKPAIIDKLLMEMTWPGIKNLEPPVPGEDEFDIANRHYVQRRFGVARFIDCHPDHLQVDHYGTTAYMACLPIGTPEALKYLGNRNMEWGFIADDDGRRVRLSWKLAVTGGKDYRIKMGHRAKDIENHIKGNTEAIQEQQRRLQAARKLHQHLLDDKPVVVGRPMLIITADTESDLATLRENVKRKMKRTGSWIIDDNEIQHELLMASMPGAKWLDRHIRVMGLAAAARAMPFITSAPQIAGPDFVGFTMGTESLPVFYDLAAALGKDASQAPVWLYVGPSGFGKTTGVINDMIPLITRAGYVGHLIDLAKFDLELLDKAQLPPELEVNMVNLINHPGCLHPVRLTVLPEIEGETEVERVARRDQKRISAMVRHLRRVCGRFYQEAWNAPLEEACQDELFKAYSLEPNRSQDDVIPSLYNVIDRLKRKRHDDFASTLRQATEDRESADLSFSNKPVRSLMTELSMPALHVIQQRGLDLPSKDIDKDDYEPSHNLALATLDLAGLLSAAVAQNRKVNVVIGHIEFSVTAQLSKGRTVADQLARFGRGYSTITIYDTQLPTDLAEDLLKQVRGFRCFRFLEDETIQLILRSMGGAPAVTPKRILSIQGLGNRLWIKDAPFGTITKGGSFMCPVTDHTQLFAVLNDRHYVNRAFLTDKSEIESEITGDPSPTLAKVA